MKASDLDRAQKLVRAREFNVKLRNQLASQEPLELTVGAVGNQSSIYLSPGFEAEIRANLIRAFDLRVSEADE
ncbi:hypothetical protein, partial [Mesorhizobium sp.]|uniref:hypothetical protein n=1 Tax=Mesorhizobium sp. TaxID=1871066 RepID=UPI00122A5132